MDSLLPSEIARLVLGYLEEQKCSEAARSFLEMSPHLQECRAVASTGRRFSTRVNGFTLADILEKFCAANAIIHERLSKVSECEQLKHCGDLLEQLRFLVDGSRGQRFVVNINVPTTSQASGGSPIISSSIRKRRHSGSERDRSKRAYKSQSLTPGKSDAPVTDQLGSDAVETTPLEHLPGHSGSERLENALEKPQERLADCSSTVTETKGLRSLENSYASVESIRLSSTPDIPKSSMEKQPKIHESCSTGTDTEELMQFTNTEVQTTYSMPCDVAESENESNNEPVENLSLLTKELLNRTELQERIAENINKAILPSDISLRDVSMSETLGGEMNTSIMTELNNAIKSVVTATESDPVFAKFLDEIIGPNAENDTSPDEDADHQPTIAEKLAYKSDSLSKETVTEILDKIVIEKPAVTEVPLKNRLRSSSSQQVIRPEDDRGSQKIVPKDDAVLEDVNAAAILSIINANNKLDEEISSMNIASESVCNDADKKIPEIKGQHEVAEMTTVSPVNPTEIDKSTVPSVEPNPCPKILKKSNFRKPRIAKTKAKIPPVLNEELLSEEEIMAMPTLIVCSKEEMTSLITTRGAVGSVTEPITGGYCSSQFLPIAPKTSEVLNLPQKPEPVYLRTVVVPTKIPKKPPIPEKELPNLPLLAPAKPRQRNRQKGRVAGSNNIKEAENNVETSIPGILDSMPIMDDKDDGKITLYSNENNAVALLDNSSVPKIHVDEPVSISGTGLSPFLKFNEKPIDNTLNTLVAMNVEPEAKEIPSTSKPDNYDLISKRTPRSLLKSRSKNNRLSLSTPRRRSSHVRALDFNTPTKCINSSRRMSTNESMEFSSKNSSFAKKVCRTSLFKSPPFTPTPLSNKINSLAKDRRSCTVPIATRSPAPKLMGGWEKYTGVGMILGCSSSSSASSSPIKATTTTTTMTTTMTTTRTTTSEQPQTSNKGWDEDLRKSLHIPEEPARILKNSTTKRQQQCKSTDEISSNCETGEIIKESEHNPNSGPCSPCPVKEEHLDFNEKIDNEPRKIEEHPIVEQSKVISGKENVNCLEKDMRSSLDNVDVSKTTETITSSITTVETASSNVMKTVKKKYAQLKTITTSVTKIDQDFLDSASETVEKSGELSRAYSEVNRQLQLSDMLDLETPRKFDCSFGIPPTPRLLSPGSSLTTPFGQIDEETSKVRGFVSTPEFPPTPSIALTPKHLSNDTLEATKKEEFGACSSYYQPSSELKDPRLPKQHSDQSRHDMSLPLPGMMLALTSEKRVQNISVQVAQGFQACTTSDKWEITQFEVIKDNLPREEAFRELKISGCANETPEVENTTIELPAGADLVDSITDDTQDTKDLNNTSSTIDDSSDSDSSSSSDSSTSSSSSSSCCSSVTDTSPNLTITRTKRTPNKIETDASNGSMHKLPENSTNLMVAQESTMSNAENVTESTNVITLYASRHENEASPQKVFSIVKTDDDLVESVVETPAKDESLLSEAVISETPSSSKAGIETTNLNSKISAFITSENREKTNEANEESRDTKKAVPKVVSVQRILPNVSMVIKPAVVSPDIICNAMENRNQISDAKLSKQLEEKRLRIMAKFKEKEKPIANKPKIKRAMSVPRNKRDTQVQRDNGKTMDGTKSEGEEKSSPKDKSACQVEKKESSMDGSSKRPQEVITASRSERSYEEDKKGPTKRNVNEEEEKEKITKNEPREKFQKRKNDEAKERILKSPSVNNEASNEERKRKDDTRKNEETEGIKRKQIHEGTKEKTNTEHKKKPSRSRSKSDLFETKKEIKEPEVKASQQPAKLVRIPEELSDGNNIDNSRVSDTIIKTVDNSKKDRKEISKESIPVESKTVAKSKVDLVKRDLFSDEESNDQRTTRSRTRQTSDAQRSDSTDSYISVVSPRAKDRPSPTPKEDLPGVLECLELVPTLKTDTSEENIGVLDCSQQCHAEYHFIYDDSVPTKRRKRKFSNSELEFPVEVELSDENFRICPKWMTATVFEEVFNLSPPRRRRATNKETTVKSTKYKKKENSGSKITKIFKGIQNQPLATSSPVLKPGLTSKVVGKSSRSPAKNSERLQTETKKKSTKNDTKQQEYERQNPKTRKRKPSSPRETEQVDKKSRPAANPQLLLHKVDLDKFLTTVHGPA